MLGSEQEIRPSFPPAEIEEAVGAKGFSVYEYLSVRELLATVQRDYLAIMAKANGPLIAASFAVGFVSFKSDHISYLFLFLLACYAGICLFLFFKLLTRTSDFLRIRTVVFGSKSLLVGDRILAYSDTEALERDLIVYEKQFEEYLTRPSQMREVISRKKKVLFDQTVGFFKDACKVTDLNRRASTSLIAIAIVVVHSVFLFTFYFLGLFFGALFFGLYALLLQIYLFFRESKERRIKRLVEGIDFNLDHLLQIEENLEQKIAEFSAGTISNIGQFIGEKFALFYGRLDAILRLEGSLRKEIEGTNYPEFFSFPTFSSYVRQRYNLPVSKMAGMLEKSLQKIEEQRTEIELLASQKDTGRDPALSANLKLRLFALEQMKQQMQLNQSKLEAMKLPSVSI